jgi:uncharacterized membrane protein (GlpM family)
MLQLVSTYVDCVQKYCISFDIFMRHTWMLCTFLVKWLPVSLNCLYQACICCLYGSILWYIVLHHLWTYVSHFISINYSAHCAFSCWSVATDLIHKDEWSASRPYIDKCQCEIQEQKEAPVWYPGIYRSISSIACRRMNSNSLQDGMAINFALENINYI